VVDGWRVLGMKPNDRLTLSMRMRAPGSGLQEASIRERCNRHWQSHYLTLRELGLNSTAAFVALARKIARLCFILLSKEINL